MERVTSDEESEGQEDMWLEGVPLDVFEAETYNVHRTAGHWGQGGLEINKNILSTLQALVESTCHLPADNRLGTFQMFLQVPG